MVRVVTSAGSTPEVELGLRDRAIVFLECLPVWAKGVAAAAVTALVILAIASFTGGGEESAPPVPAGSPVPTSEPGGPIVLPPGESFAR